VVPEVDALREIDLGPASDFADPGRKVIDVDGTEFAVFHVRGEFSAFENVCTHMGGPACQGKMLPLVVEDVQPDGTSRGMQFSKNAYNVICPWHGFEYDIRTGIHAGYPRFKLRSTPVRVEAGNVLVTVPERIPTPPMTQFQLGGA
jgi:nitrite reductase/ring-hydroxylating ferredoxin subunit